MFENIGKYLWIRSPASGALQEREEWRGVVGAKALGLAALPAAWTPEFLVVGTSLYRDWRAAPNAEKSDTISSVASEIATVATVRFVATDQGLVIRSSAANESMSLRGAYDSLELTADFNATSIASAIEQISSNFLQSSDGDELALIIQVRARLEKSGHISNERRVSKTENHWAWEVESPEYDAGRFNSQRATPPSEARLLECGDSKKDLLEVFRKVGRWCTQLNRGRVHLEWGQSAGVLWLLQLDFENEQPEEGVDPNILLRAEEAFEARRLPQDAPIHLANFNETTGWSKIDKVRSFLDDQNVLYPALYYVTGSDLKSALENRNDLQSCIAAVVGDRLVCRTDCVAKGIDRLNLPRTDSVSAAKAVSFMASTLRDLSQQGAKEAEVCFIFHKFIPSQVAAWALARPDSQLVLVDSVWGLPDGLQYLPHDTFEFDVKQDAISAEYIRYKPKFLQETENGEWRLVTVARHLARHKSLPLADLRDVATRTHSIAVRVAKPVQIMWFCAISDAAKIGRNIPWFMMDPEPSSGKPSRSIAPNQKRIKVKSLEDLDAARSHQSGRVVLALDPESELFRSVRFLDEVAAVALERNFPVAMTGSILAHAYYTLERKGVSVVTDTSGRTRVRQRQIFRKLVRDEIPSKIALHGERANLARIAKSESRMALIIKLFEEAQELLKATSPQDVTTELADLLEVVRALAVATGVDWSEVQAVAEEKRKARGSFDKNVVLMETSWPRWTDPVGESGEKLIPLRELGDISPTAEGHLVNFAAALAKDADNIITLASGLVIQVAIVEGGIQIAIKSQQDQNGDDQQLAFDFTKKVS